jgi:hypothetical protein
MVCLFSYVKDALMTAYLLAAPIMLAFATLPGAWLLFTLPFAPLRWSVRLTLAVALSPALLAVQALVLKALHIPFAVIPTLLLIANLPALWLVMRAWRRSGQSKRPIARGSWLGGGALLLLLGGYVALPWRLVPHLRTFAWHALWHTDIAYALTRNSLLPEEPELAGMRLSYSWAGHLFWSITGWLSDLPPTVLYAATNLLWLAVAAFLAYALCRDGLQLPRPLAVFGSGAIFLGTNIAGVVGWSYARDWHWRQEILGDLRYTPMLGKYLGFETMPFAFALLMGLALVTAVAVRQPIRRLWVLLTALLIALGLLYPILYPAGCIIVGVFWLVLAWQLFTGAYEAETIYTKQTLITVALGGILSAVVTFGFLTLVTLDGNNAPIHLTATALFKTKATQVVVGLLLFAPALVALVTQLRHALAVRLLLAGATVGLMALYVAADLESLEYKYVLAATIVAAPLSAAGLAWLLRTPAQQWTVTVAVLLTLAGANQLLMLQIGAQIPTNLGNAPQVQEAGFWLQLQPTQREAGWVTAIRTQTPATTVVVTADSRIHVSPFLDRSLYAPSDWDGAQIAGYSVDNRYNLLSWRGYSPTLYEARLAEIQALQGDQAAEWIPALETMLALQRPLALHLTADRPLLQWLAQAQLGTVIYRTDEDVVWLLDPAVITAQQLESAEAYASH